MWYFSWILGLLLACSLGVISLLWLEAQEAWAREHVTLDPLTHLFDQKEMTKRLREKIENSNRNESPFSVIYISLNAFREKHDLIYNEMDTIIRSVAEIFQEEIRAGVDIAFRYADEEFIIALPGVSLAKAKEIALIIGDIIKVKVTTADAIPIVVDVGVAEYIGNSAELMLDEDMMNVEVNNLLQFAKGNRV
jgi:cyd operon protein YbgT